MVVNDHLKKCRNLAQQHNNGTLVLKGNEFIIMDIAVQMDDNRLKQRGKQNPIHY
jgi:hypothetical protein